MSQLSTSRNFYAKLPAFTDFDDIAQANSFQALPNDWVVLVADVIGSTKAIEQGDYKKVNMIGAASIICVLNIADELSLPFMFGGDGGLIAVPQDLAEAASMELTRLQATSHSMFGLGLRAAAIPVDALRAAGADILVKKFELSAGNTLAMFAGTGPAMADGWLKADVTARGYSVAEDVSGAPPDLSGLSCRWEPIKSQNGVMLTIIVQPNESDIVEANKKLDRILDGHVERFAPARADNLRFRFPFKGLRLEIAAGRASGIKHIIWTCITATMQYICEKCGLKIGDYNGENYRQEIQTNTDFRKFDGALRMVLDVGLEQATAIEAFLEEQYGAGRLIYGTWRSEHALMTCLLFSLAESRHVHFIDGADGGYAMAAKALKQRKI